MPSLFSRLMGAGAPSRAPELNIKASRTGPLLALQTLGLRAGCRAVIPS